VEVEQISYLEGNYDMSVERQAQWDMCSCEAKLEAETHICERNIGICMVSSL
jgi:hypothetical protein